MLYYQTQLGKLYHGDCLNKFKSIQGNSIDLIVIDPPYNINKASWDKYKQQDYIEFMGQVFAECERILKENGSFYWFHNDFLQIVELQTWLNQNSKFVFKRFIVWNKRYHGSPRKWYFDNVIQSNMDKNYRLMAEYILFYTFQDDTGLSLIQNDQYLFSSIRKYFYSERKKTNLSYNEINEKCFGTASNGGGMASNILTPYKKNWTFPTEEKYKKLQNLGICKRSYESLRQEYESLRQEYESLRYVFNNQKTHHSVWDYEIAKKVGHITPKPLILLKNIIKHSSNENDLVLDCFMGSGTTAVACERLNRRWIGIEKEEKYCQIVKERLEKETEQLKLF